MHAFGLKTPATFHEKGNKENIVLEKATSPLNAV